jgi:hypothetical protein
MRPAAADAARLLLLVAHEHVAARGAERYALRAASHGADKSSCTTPRKHWLRRPCCLLVIITRCTKGSTPVGQLFYEGNGARCRSRVGIKQRSYLT